MAKKTLETPQAKPEKLIPHHLGIEVPEIEEVRKKGASGKELYEMRQEHLEKVPDLEDDKRLRAVEEFRRLVKEAQDLRKVVKEVSDPKEKNLALALYSQKKKTIEGFLHDEETPSFEKAYREYIRSENEYLKFTATREKINQLENLLQEPSFASLPENKKFDQATYARLESVMGQSETSAITKQSKELDVTLAALRTIYPENSKEYEEAKNLLLGSEEGSIPATKKEMETELVKLNRQLAEMWDDQMIRYLAGSHEWDKILDGFAKGKDVIETQGTIKNLNKLHEWETLHQQTTIGGVLVGPPGVGKTTLIRHYLEEKDRNYVYIDLSEDVTRYLLYGSKSIEFKSPAEYYKRLIDDLEQLDDEGYKNFVADNSKLLKSVFRAKDDEAHVAFISQVEDELEKAQRVSPDMNEKIKNVREKVQRLAQKAFQKELALEFSHIVKRNGWRDGMVIAALRRGDSVIFDEFNKNKNWSLIYSLITSKPGEKWYFSDNDEWISVPKDWRMFFTANIGRKHGGFKVAEAFASRASGKIMEVGYPSAQEEMQIALASLASPEGDFLRSKEDLAKLLVLVNEAFPGIRNLIQDKEQSIPISFRTLRDIGEKLVIARDPKSGKPIYRPTNITFNEAVYDILVNSYPIYEAKEIPREIVQYLISVGLLLDDSVKEDVLKWVDKDKYEENRKRFEAKKEEFEEIVKKIRGLSKESMLASDLPPARRAFKK